MMRPRSSFRLRTVQAFLICLATFVSACGRADSPPSAVNNNTPALAAPAQNALAKVRSSGTIDAGWAPYAPYSMKNLQTGRVEGYYLELFERGMAEANLKVNWVETTWSTMIADLKAGKFVVMAAPVFRTPARAVEVAFTHDIDKFGLSALARPDTASRFKTLDAFNNANTTIALVVGEVGFDFAKRRLPQAKRIEHSSGDISVALVDVIQGRADVGITDALTIRQFTAAHKGQVVDLFADRPFNQVGAGWYVDPRENELKNFLDTTIDWLKSSGTTGEIAPKYGLTAQP